MKTVILSEKPDQAKKYANALGQPKWKDGAWRLTHQKLGDVAVVSAVGHIVQQDNPLTDNENWKLENLPIFPKEFTYSVVSNKKDVFSRIKKAVSQADAVIVATDPGREGEAIAYRILEKIPKAMSKVKYRLWCKSLSKQGILKSFDNLLPAQETINFYHEATARSVSDWLVGFNLSPFTTIKMQKDGLLDKKDKPMSVGRVQTPIVNLVVENDEAIEQFSPVPFWKLQLVDPENEVTFTNKELFYQKEEAEKFSNSLPTTLKISGIKTEEVKKNSPALFDLASLQAYMSQHYQWSPDYTLQMAQELYTKEVTSYPRTDSKTITHFEFSYLNNEQYLTHLATGIDLNGFEKVKEKLSKIFMDDEKTGEHHAIIPTEVFPNPEKESFSDDEILLYKEIARRTLLMFERDYIYQKTVVILENNGVQFSTTGTRLLDSGWKRFLTNQEKSKDLPVYYEKGLELNLEKIIVEDETKPPKRLTENELFKTTLKKYNLGTSATRAGIFKNILDRGYIQKDKKTGQLYPLDRGRKLIAFLKQFNIMYTNVDTTKIWEEALLKVGQGRLHKDQFILQTKMAISKQIEEVIRQEKLKSLGESYQESQAK